MKKKYPFVLSVTLISLLAACGSGRDLATDSGSTPLVKPSAAVSSANDELANAIPQILKGIEDIKQEIKGLQINQTTGTSPKPASSAKPGASPTPRPGATPGPGATPSPSSSSAPGAALKGKAELMAVMEKIRTAPYVVLTAEKNEKNLTTGKITYNKIKMSSRQPNLVKIEIIKSSSGSDGVQALYTSGVGNTIKIKKLFIKLDLAKNDSRVISNNGYPGDKIDLFGVSQRMATGYDAELVGTTDLNGTTLNVLKVTTSGSNQMDDRISYEYLGYEPDTHAIRLWEAYDKSGSKDPFYRMTLLEISFPDTLPDSTFTL